MHNAYAMKVCCAIWIFGHFFVKFGTTSVHQSPSRGVSQITLKSDIANFILIFMITIFECLNVFRMSCDILCCYLLLLSLCLMISFFISGFIVSNAYGIYSHMFLWFVVCLYVCHHACWVSYHMEMWFIKKFQIRMVWYIAHGDIVHDWSKMCYPYCVEIANDNFFYLRYFMGWVGLWGFLW